MQLFARSGQRGKALEQYEACHRVLDDELGVAPMPDTTALYEQIRAGHIEQDRSQPDTAKASTDRYADALTLTRAFHDAVTAKPPSKIAADGPLIETLTERELDVLRLKAQNRTNQEIADELVLALSTVKWYVRQVYGKWRD